MPSIRKDQTSSCPDGWIKAGIKVPVNLTARQEKYATRCTGIARSVFNLMVATHHMARTQCHGKWPNPMEMEKVFNDLKHEPDFGMEYATRVSKFVAQGACRDFRHAYENWRNPDLRAARPSFKRRTASAPDHSWPHPALRASGTMATGASGFRTSAPVKLKRELPHGLPYEVRIKRENGRLVRQHQLLEAARRR